MSIIDQKGREQLERLDLLARELEDEISSSREEARVVSENLAGYSQRAAESSRRARAAANEALGRAADIELSTARRTRRRNP